LYVLRKAKHKKPRIHRQSLGLLSCTNDNAHCTSSDKGQWEKISHSNEMFLQQPASCRLASQSELGDTRKQRRHGDGVNIKAGSATGACLRAQQWLQRASNSQAVVGSYRGLKSAVIYTPPTDSFMQPW